MMINGKALYFILLYSNVSFLNGVVFGGVIELLNFYRTEDCVCLCERMLQTILIHRIRYLFMYQRTMLLAFEYLR